MCFCPIGPVPWLSLSYASSSVQSNAIPLIVRLLAEIFHAVDLGQVTLLSQNDICAVFNTVGQERPVHVLHDA